jgi:hypothetical protein
MHWMQRCYRTLSSATGAGRLVNKKAVVTASLNGVLTDPAKFSIPVTPVCDEEKM